MSKFRLDCESQDLKIYLKTLKAHARCPAQAKLISAQLRPNHHHSAAMGAQHAIARVNAKKDGTQQEHDLSKQLRLFPGTNIDNIRATTTPTAVAATSAIATAIATATNYFYYDCYYRC